MKIKEITGQHRRDFTALYECEYCGSVKSGRGYDDANFHQNVVPNMVCGECGEKAPTSFLPLTTKYPEGMQL
jgi:transcription elongation factor Elf1